MCNLCKCTHTIQKLRMNQKKLMNLCVPMLTSLPRMRRKTKSKGMPLVKDLRQGSFRENSETAHMRKTTQATAAISQ